MELLENWNTAAHEAYSSAIMANAHFHRVCSTAAEWAGNALTGYSETSRCLERNHQHLLYLLYGIARRTFSYIVQRNPEQADILSVVRERLDRFFTDWIEADVPNGYQNLFNEARLNQATKLCVGLSEKAGDHHCRQHLAFTMVGIFFADLHLVLTEYADNFYKQINHKVNIKLEPNHFHAHVPAPRIQVRSDPDRRSAYIKLWCNDATAHKIAILFVKEFDLSLNKLEDFFKLIGFKLYYLLPQIEKDADLDALDNYNFEAYIPTLLPLLIGDNIYHSKEVFARELIQNAIDAISVREAVEGRLTDEERVIRIFLGQEKDNRPVFQITDHGTGMDRYKVERYFTSIGRSYYSAEDYAELNIGYQPISSFGIGFLSAFMVCQEVDVRTRSFQGEQEGLKLHIPNYEGCFFIERTGDAKIGTEITLYLDPAYNNDRIPGYIRRSMRDIKYDIEIYRQAQLLMHIPAHSVRQKSVEKQIASLFVPFLENGTVGQLDWEQEVFSGEFIKVHDYGLLVNLGHHYSIEDSAILNAGIVTSYRPQMYGLFNKSLSEFISKNRQRIFGQQHRQVYNRFIFNFPSDWIRLDVSREKVVGFSPKMENRYMEKGAAKYLQNAISYALKEQIESLLRCCAEDKLDLPAASISEFFDFIRHFNPHLDTTLQLWLDKQTYIVKTLFTEQGIQYTLCHNHDRTQNFSSYENDAARERGYTLLKEYTQFDPIRITSQIHNIQTSDFENMLFDIRYRIAKLEKLSNNMPKLNSNRFSFLGLSALIDGFYTHNADNRLKEGHFWEIYEEFKVQYMQYVKGLLLSAMTAGMVERGEAELFISYEEINNKAK